MINFKIKIRCKSCGSTNVDICKHQGKDDSCVILVCRNKKCRYKERMDLKLE